QTRGEVVFRHEHAAGVIIANVEHDERPAVVILGNIVNCSGTGEAMHNPKPNSKLIKHGGKHAADSTFFRPHLNAGGLLVPKVTAIGSCNSTSVLLGVVPGRHPFQAAGLVNNPIPWDGAVFTCLFEQAIDALHFRPRHRRNQASGEQFVADATAGDGLRRLCGSVHGFNEVEGALSFAPAYFETSLSLLGHSSFQCVWVGGRGSGAGTSFSRRAERMSSNIAIASAVPITSSAKAAA